MEGKSAMMYKTLVVCVIVLFVGLSISFTCVANLEKEIVYLENIPCHSRRFKEVLIAYVYGYYTDIDWDYEVIYSDRDISAIGIQNNWPRPNEPLHPPFFPPLNVKNVHEVWFQRFYGHIDKENKYVRGISIGGGVFYSD